MLNGAGSKNIEASETSRSCRACLMLKPIEEFPVRSDSRTRRNICRRCKSSQGTASRRKRYSAHPEVHQAFKDAQRIYRNAKTRALKTETLRHYGPNNEAKCACCWQSGDEFLTIDHIAGGGRTHMKWLREIYGVVPGSDFYLWLKRNKWPDGFQVLCWNCNCAKGHFGMCPHQKERETTP